MQLFRFAAAIGLLVAISLTGIALQKQKLSRQRAISLQQYRIEQLLDRQAHLRVRINELTSPTSKQPSRSLIGPVADDSAGRTSTLTSKSVRSEREMNVSH